MTDRRPAPSLLRAQVLALLAAVAVLSCDHARSAPAPPPSPSASATSRETAAPPGSLFRVVVEGANGDDEHYTPYMTLCPVQGAVLLCGTGSLLQVSVTAGVTRFDEVGAREVRGRWPSQLWTISADDQHIHALQQSPTGWTQRVRLGTAGDVSTWHQSASWGDGGLAILTEGFRSQETPYREYVDLVVRTITREGKVLPRALTDRQGRPLVTYGYSIHGLGAQDLLVAGQTGGKGIQDGTPALFLWRGSERFPERLKLPDETCKLEVLEGAPDDVHVFGERAQGSRKSACGYRVTATEFMEIPLPPAPGSVTSYSRAPDGTQWIVVRERTGILGRAGLWSRRPDAPWEPVALPAPALARTTRWGPIVPDRVHVDEGGRVWVGAAYRERCGRALLLATDATATPCRLGMSEALCTARPEQEHRNGACPEVRDKGEEYND